jgi:hypothetical protein
LLFRPGLAGRDVDQIGARLCKCFPIATASGNALAGSVGKCAPTSAAVSGERRASPGTSVEAQPVLQWPAIVRAPILQRRDEMESK